MGLLSWSLIFPYLLLFSLLTSLIRPTLAVDLTSRNPNNSINNSSTQGWTSSPDGRGSFDIIWSCVSTIFLCSWTVLCVQVPALDEDEWVLFRRKFYLTCLGIAGPEFILMLAIGQWASAHRSLKEFQLSGYKDWTMNHAFFADMGGFVLHPRDWTPFPIDAKQLHYLVVKGYLPYPAIDKRVIADRNKIDGLVRFITVGQTLWFTANCITRSVQHLAITTLELTTVAFIFCTLGTSFCWAHKPADVDRAIILEANCSIADILREAGDCAREPYRNTPLDFVSRKEWSWSLYWSFWINLLRGLRIVFRPKVRPINRFPNDAFPELADWGLIAFSVFSIGYGAIFLGGWNFSFPTNTERLLWRVASTMSLGAIVGCWIVDTAVFRVLPAMRAWRSKSKKSQGPETGIRLRWVGAKWIPPKVKAIAAKVRNNSLDQDPALTVPLKALLPATLTGIIYVLARAYIIVEDFAGLRALPPSAFDTVDWTKVIPHI